METELSGGFVSEYNTPQTFSYSRYLDEMCPYYMLYGMGYDEYWHGSIDRLNSYWQKHQFEIEQRNQEMWMQGLYFRLAVASCLDNRNKYPTKPHRITEMTDVERELDNKRRVEQLREQLMAIKSNWDAKHKGDEAG